MTINTRDNEQEKETQRDRLALSIISIAIVWANILLLIILHVVVVISDWKSDIGIYGNRISIDTVYDTLVLIVFIACIAIHAVLTIYHKKISKNYIVASCACIFIANIILFNCMFSTAPQYLLILTFSIYIIVIALMKIGEIKQYNIIMQHNNNKSSANIEASNHAKSLKVWLDKYDKDVPEFWKEIGREVYSRKTLLLASIEALHEADKNNLHFIYPEVLAATDVFVEKAQRLLSERGMLLVVIGCATSSIALFLLLYAAYAVYNSTIGEILPSLTYHGYDEKIILTIAIFKASSAGAFLGAAVYFLSHLSFVLFHEGLNHFNKRHALRFGRLYVYAKRGDISFEEMVQAFKWHDEFTTAFRGFKADHMTNSPFSQLTRLPPELMKEIVDAFKVIASKIKTD